MSLPSSRNSKRREKYCKRRFYRVNVRICIMHTHYDSRKSLHVSKSLPRPWRLAHPGTRTFISLICQHCSLLFAVTDRFDYGIEMVDGMDRRAKDNGLIITRCSFFLSFFSLFFFLMSLVCLWIHCSLLTRRYLILALAFYVYPDSTAGDALFSPPS